MGSYSVLRINNLEIAECKYGIPEIVFSLFDYDYNMVRNEEIIDGEKFERIGFNCKKAEAYKRLKIKRYINKDDIRDKYQNEFMTEYYITAYAEDVLDERVTDEEFEGYIINNFSYEKWIEAQHSFIEQLLQANTDGETYIEFANHVLDDSPFLEIAKRRLSEGGDPLYLFNGIVDLKDEECALLLLELLGEEDEISCDISELIESGDIELKEVKKKFELSPKAVLLTEGTTDMNFIHDCMKIIYPKYVSSFHYTDLSSVKSDCIILKSYLLMLGATETKGNYCGIFDNDTAASPSYKEAIRKNKRNNIRIIKLPDDEEFNDYPYKSIDNKILSTNINGLAVSIELFYPDGVLKNSGSFEPIMWTNYDKKEKRYQGHLENKENVQSRWETYKKYKTRHHKEDDFRRAKKLLDAIVNAFL